MRLLTAVVMIVLAFCALSVGTKADTFRRGDGLTLIWVKIRAKPGEGLWEACRRVYRHDVYQVRRGRGATVWCNIDHSRLYGAGERRQNFNRPKR